MIKIFRNIRKKLLKEGKITNYLKYAIGEIVLVVIGILIALQVNNWNENRIEQNRIKKYAKSIIQDLEADIEMMKVSKNQAEKGFNHIDSLRKYMIKTPIINLSNTDLFVLTHDILYRPYKWNRSTFEELKSSGSLRYVKNDSLEKKMVAYETFTHHLDEDFVFDRSSSEKASEMISLVLNLNSSYFKIMLEGENERFDDAPFYLFQTSEYYESSRNDLNLINYDEQLIQKFTNTFILIQDQYNIRAFKEMPQIIEDANELISILKKEYNL